MESVTWILPYLKHWWVIKGILVYVIPWLIGWIVIVTLVIQLWLRWMFGKRIYWEDVTNARIE